MRRKNNEDDFPVGDVNIVVDFLPPPEKLVPVRETVKITLALEKDSLAFFKKRATKLGLKYQRMIREVLSGYARKYAS